MSNENRKILQVFMTIFLVTSATTKASDELISFGVRPSTTEAQIGDSIIFDVLVKDERSVPLGIVSAYVDLHFPADRLELVPGSVIFGPKFGENATHGTGTPGLVDETGSLIAGLLDAPPLPAPVGIEAEVLFSAEFVAVATGESMLTTDMVDLFPRHATTLLGIDDAVGVDAMRFGHAVVKVVPEPSSAASLSLLLLAFGSYLAKREDR